MTKLTKDQENKEDKGVEKLKLTKNEKWTRLIDKKKFCVAVDRIFLDADEPIEARKSIVIYNIVVNKMYADKNPVVPDLEIIEELLLSYDKEKAIEYEREWRLLQGQVNIRQIDKDIEYEQKWQKCKTREEQIKFQQREKAIEAMKQIKKREKKEAKQRKIDNEVYDLTTEKGIEKQRKRDKREQRQKRRKEQDEMADEIMRPWAYKDRDKKDIEDEMERAWQKRIEQQEEEKSRLQEIIDEEENALAEEKQIKEIIEKQIKEMIEKQKNKNEDLTGYVKVVKPIMKTMKTQLTKEKKKLKKKDTPVSDKLLENQNNLEMKDTIVSDKLLENQNNLEMKDTIVSDKRSLKKKVTK